MQLVMYISDYDRPLSDLNSDLRAILKTAITHNLTNNITGILFFDKGKFIQILEGEAEHLTPLLDRIQLDTRHKNVNILMNEPIEKREIDNWSMKAFDLSENEPQDWASLEELRDAYLNTFKVSSKQISSWIEHFIKDYPRFKQNERI
ncbi:BLUF domain-containing protein [Pseudomonas sp. HK3]